MVLVGYEEKSTRMSCATKKTLTAWREALPSNAPSFPRNLVRFRLERLQAESSRNMYSEQGLLALIRAVFGQGCQRLIVLSYCTPGSAHPHAASASWRQRSLALKVSTTSPVVRAWVSQVPPVDCARMNASLIRIELFEFCPLIVW